MKFHILLNDEDYISFNIIHFFNSPANKRTILIGKFTPLAVSVLSVLLSIIFDFGELFIGIEVVLLGAYSIYGFLSYPKTAEKQIRKLMENLRKDGKLPYESDWTIEFLDEQMHITAPSEKVYRKYSEVTGILRDEERIYVVVGALQAIILPLKCLEGKGKELMDFLDTKLRKSDS